MCGVSITDDLRAEEMSSEDYGGIEAFKKVVTGLGHSITSSVFFFSEELRK